MTRLGNFLTIRLLFEGSLGFLSEEMTQKMVTPLATSLVHLQRNKLFQNMVCILEFFGLATVLATFKKLGDFFRIIWLPCIEASKKISCF